MIAMGEMFPIVLYRAYKKSEYAEKFVYEGIFFIGKLEGYRDIEDQCRADNSEGLGYYQDNDGIHEHSELIGDIYLLSLSTNEVDLDFLSRKMGRNIIKINDPGMLAKDIENYLHNNGYGTFGGVKGEYIQYNKGESIEGELSEMDRAVLSVTQKPKGFSPECEYRLFTNLNSQWCFPPSSGYIGINLRKRLDYADIISNGI